MVRSTVPPPPAARSYSARQPRDLLEEADRLRQQGRLDRAESTCYALVRQYPDYVAALHTLGLVYLDKGDFERALDCLVRAVMRDPTNWMTLTALSLVYLRLGATEMATETLNKALGIRPADASILSSLGEIHRQACDYDLAEEAYRQALTLDPQMETPAVGLALCLAARGQPTEAAQVLTAAYGRGVRSLNLLQVLTTLPAKAAQIDILAALNQLTARQTQADSAFKTTCLFVKAAALDAAARPDEAWDAVQVANRPMAIAHQAALKTHVLRRDTSLARIKSDSRPGRLPTSPADPVSLFVLGPSRSGKTTLERLISTLDGVKAGGEYPVLETAARRSFQADAMPAGRHLEDLPEHLLASFREFYRDNLARRAGQARVVVNTLPSSIHNALLIARTIPNARFVLMKRNRADTAWRIYLTQYLGENPYAYDLKAIGAYLAWYDAMIDLVVEKLPEITRIVGYDAMVDDPSATLSMVAALCGLGPPGLTAPTLPDDRACATPYRKYLDENGF